MKELMSIIVVWALGACANLIATKIVDKHVSTITLVLSIWTGLMAPIYIAALLITKKST